MRIFRKGKHRPSRRSITVASIAQRPYSIAEFVEMHDKLWAGRLYTVTVPAAQAVAR